MGVLGRSMDKSFIRRLWTDNAGYTVQRRIWLCGGYMWWSWLMELYTREAYLRPGPRFFLLTPFFSHYFLFGVNSLAFDSCSVLTLIFFFFFHFCLLLQSGWIRWLLRISVGEKGWCVSTTFFSSYYVLSLLGYFRIVFFFLAVTWFCGFSLLERSKMGAVFGCDISFSHFPSNPLLLPLTPFVSSRGFSTFVLPLELVLGRAFFCLSVAFAFVLRFSCSCFLWALSLSLSLSRDSGSFVFPSLSY